MSTALATLTSKLASRLDMGDGSQLIETLKATAFKGQVSDAQMTALMVVANQYGLNPWTKEIYAFPDKQNGIVPVVGVDGWSRIINNHEMLDGIEFKYSTETIQHKNKACHEWIECLIYRKDRSKPIIIREFFSEVVRNESFKTPWDTHPNRMHRHKALIQCARVAFGFTGIYDEDEAARIVEAKDMGTVERVPEQPKEKPPYDQAKFDAIFPQWEKLVLDGKKTSDAIISTVTSIHSLTDGQINRIKSIGKIDTETGEIKDDPWLKEFEGEQQ